MSTLERVKAALTGIEHDARPGTDGTTCVEVSAADAHAAIERLRDRASFETNTFVTAVDRHPAEPRFEVVWQFMSVASNDRVRVRARLPGEAPRVRTITDLYPGSAFSERECYDMFGIVFEGHAGLKRLLLPQGYEHHPLRKDFPHQGLEPDRLYREWDRRRRERPANQGVHKGPAEL